MDGGRISVAIRVRPLNDREKSSEQIPVWQADNNSIIQLNPLDGRPFPNGAFFRFGIFYIPFSFFFFLLLFIWVLRCGVIVLFFHRGVIKTQLMKTIDWNLYLDWLLSSPLFRSCICRRLTFNRFIWTSGKRYNHLYFEWS